MDFSELRLRTRRPCTGVKIPKIGKRGFRGQKTPIPQRPRKGCFESENPHFFTGHGKESALLWGAGKWELFDPETYESADVLKGPKPRNNWNRSKIGQK